MSIIKSKQFEEISFTCSKCGVKTHRINERSETRIRICCAASILAVSEESVRTGDCGTQNLTRVRAGEAQTAPLIFCLEEVWTLKNDAFEQARRADARRDTKLKLAGANA